MWAQWVCSKERRIALYKRSSINKKKTRTVSQNQTLQLLYHEEYFIITFAFILQLFYHQEYFIIASIWLFGIAVRLFVLLTHKQSVSAGLFVYAFLVYEKPSAESNNKNKQFKSEVCECECVCVCVCVSVCWYFKHFEHINTHARTTRQMGHMLTFSRLTSRL